MKRFNFNKPLVESLYPPQNTNVLWVDINESTGKISTIRKFKNGEWVDYIQFASDPVIKPADNEIWYKTSDNSILNIQLKYFTPLVISNTINNEGYGVVVFDSPITELKDHAFDYFYDSASRKKIIKLILPDCIESFGRACFREMSNAEINIPASLKGLIPWNCFHNCRGIKQLIFPTGVTHIGDSSDNNDAVSYCSALEYVYIPEGVVEIGSNAFAECESLREIELPSTLTKLGDSVFWGGINSELTDFSISISFRGTVELWNNIEKPENWYYLPTHPKITCIDGIIPEYVE